MDKQESACTTILDLPTELIVHVCRNIQLTYQDIVNLTIAHHKFHECIFDEQNSSLWKTKYFQRYGTLDVNEYEIVIDEQNTWKNEFIYRMSLEHYVNEEISEMPSKYLKYKNVPYHLYPFSSQLHSSYQAHRFYVLSAILNHYKHLKYSNLCNENYDKLYVVHHFLMYSCQVVFGYKLKDFLKLPQSAQTIERGFYLLGRWWCPIVETSYNDMSNCLNNISAAVCKHIWSINPTHPLVEQENYMDQVIERSKSNLDYDLFDESNTITILDSIRQVVFVKYAQFICNCHDDINCFLLQKVLEHNRGSVFLLCVIYESVARRLGVKVKLTATSVHNFVTWSSSWPGYKHKTRPCYLIDVAGGGVMRLATVCPVSGKLPGHYNGNSIPDLFWTFSKSMEQLASTTFKYVLDFQKLMRPEDMEVEYKCQKFHYTYDYCRCPLIRDSLSPCAPNHIDERNTVYQDYEEMFPSVPKRRGTANDPKFAIGMMVDVIGKGSIDDPGIIIRRGVVVGWTGMPNAEPLPNLIVYYVLMRPDPEHYCNFSRQQNPVIKAIWETRQEKLERNLIPTDHHFKNIGKFFTQFSLELDAFVPIKALADLYPDDLEYTIAEKNRLGDPINVPMY
ncbi:uncharacterized protein LOC126843670 [Adelges cooleyi]|uniref:uncharacterized protein LOC126843670 n=1 Tax=Adelges cooleyi TaxID=133065 RepID=UPI0021808200|nr:uncharacterized protein LOC126843670 [Adelges cooleyi]XP_050437297.1 uncharacterized protein LOC126843670 [Adelges cooleyi]